MTKQKDKTFKARVEEVFEAKIKPTVQMDGGDIFLVNCDEASGTVTVRLGGACIGCPLSSITLTLGVERELLESIPEFMHLEVEED
ncbi:MAG: NifU family protein [Patescibacteria group bacterium]